MRSTMAVAASCWAQPLVVVVAGVVAARKMRLVTSSPHSDFAMFAGVAPVRKARTCAVAALARYVAARGRSRPKSCGIGNGLAVIVLLAVDPDRACSKNPAGDTASVTVLDPWSITRRTRGASHICGTMVFTRETNQAHGTQRLACAISSCVSAISNRQ